MTRKRVTRLAAKGSEIEDPLRHLLRRVGEAERWLGVVRGQVEQLVAAGRLTLLTQAGEDVRAVVKAYERALDRSFAFSAKVAQLSIDDRLTAIAERDLALVERAFEVIYRSALEGKTLDEARADAARQLVLVQQPDDLG